MTLINPDLKGLYTRIYLGEPWPAPLPRPEEVGFCWNHRFDTTRCICYQKEKIIEVNVIYRDPRLSPELGHLRIAAFSTEMPLRPCWLLLLSL